MSKATPEAVQAVFHPDSLCDEVAHLNRLLDDSNLTISCLFQLLRDHNIHVGSTELIKAREKVEVEMRALRTANAGLVEKVRRLENAGDKMAELLDCYAGFNETEYNLPAALERIRVLNEALRPLVAMWKRHEQIVSSGKGSGQEDAYYCFYSGQHNRWEKAVEAIEDGGKP